MREPHASCSGTRTTAPPPGLVKFDLLGLGMLGALHDAWTSSPSTTARSWSSHDPRGGRTAVYEMFSDADTVGVFQIESRAQMATLPRLRPREFYDLVVEVALIRPGPIQGGAVHPYLRRRNGDEESRPAPNCWRSRCARTLGVPLFQEQAMQMAIDGGRVQRRRGRRLRRAMGAKRSRSACRAKERLMAGMAERGISGEMAEDIYQKLEAFSSGYGFPEIHSISFAYIV